MTKEEWLRVKGGFNTNAEKTFEEIYNALWKTLYSVALNYIHDTAAAQEVVQDVFVNLWVKRERLQSVDDIRPFAMRAIRNRIYDHFDKVSVQQRYIHRVAQSETHSVNATQEQVEYEETFSLIDTEIDRLPHTTRTVFRLSRFDKFTNEEIATQLQLSVKSVEYHVTQALKKLRVRLKYTGTVLLLLLFF